MRNREGGITLIALVTTIIVLLILAGVSISMITDRGSAIRESKEQAAQAERESIIEKIEADLLTEKTKTGNTPDKEKLIEIINEKYGTASEDAFTSKDGNYTINLSEIVGWKNQYIQDNLILHYDGINNTGEGDYVNNENATVWKDLSGNNNDGILYNMDTDTGYYSLEDDGYVFLENSSYIESTKNIGISGDAKFTVEVVANLWEDGTNPNYSAYNNPIPLWFGGSTPTVGSVCYFSYLRSSNKFAVSFINNLVMSDTEYKIVGKNIYMSFRKTKQGQINLGDTDIGKINYNGQNVSNTYGGTSVFTPNIVDSKVQVGRGWQYNNENRTFYGAIKAIRIYNRALTDEEINNNYELDKDRFNIQ